MRRFLRIVAAALAGGVAWVVLVLRRRLRLARHTDKQARARDAPRCAKGVWTTSDLAALEMLPDYLFTYKRHDLHIDHPESPVTLQTQLCARYPELRDTSTGHGFRLIHQLDYATSGVLAVGLSKKAAARGAKLFAERRAGKCYLALVHGVLLF